MAEKDEAKVWYLQYTENGKEKKMKADTGKVIEQIKSGRVTAKTLASNDPKGPFRPLGSFPVFAKMIQARQVQEKVDKAAEARDSTLTDLVDDFDAHQARYERQKLFKKIGTGLVQLVVLVVVVGAGGWGIWTYLIEPAIPK